MTDRKNITKRILEVAIAAALAALLMANPMEGKAQEKGNTIDIMAAQAPLSAGSVEINETNFPDPVFRELLLGRDFGADGIITETEVENITALLINESSQVKDLTGIEYFTDLTYLNCDNSGITKLDVRANTALEMLYCSDTGIRGLDVSKNTALQTLYCSGTELAWLNLGENANLSVTKSDTTISVEITEDTFNIQDQFEGIDPGKITVKSGAEYDSATGVFSSYNREKPIVYTYDCGTSSWNSPEILQVTWFVSGGVKGIEISETNFPDPVFRELLLGRDFGADGIITETEVEKITVLRINESSQVKDLTGIEYFKGLRSLTCYSKAITQLDVSQNMALESLDCRETGITALDLSANTALVELTCYGTGITELDISRNTKLKSLYCSNTRITGLDVSQNTALEELDCSDTGITSLDVSENRALVFLICSDCPLTWLNIGENEHLAGIIKSDSSIALEISASIFNIADKYPGIDPAKISAVSGADYDKTTGVFSNYTKDAPTIVYTYDCGTSSADTKQTLQVTLNLQGVREDSVIKITEDLNKTYDGNRVNSTPAVDVSGSTGAVSYRWEKKENASKWTPIDTVPADAGTYRVTAIVASDEEYYEASSVPTTFTIAPKNAGAGSQIKVPEISESTDLGELTIKDGDKVLIQGKDYDVKKTQNGKTVTVTVTFKGNYKGTIAKTYIVQEKEPPKSEEKDNPSGKDGTKNAAVQTGDTTANGLWLMLLTLSGGIVILQKRKVLKKGQRKSR